MPRNPDRIDRINAKLLFIWKLNPDMRLGQLIVNVARQVIGSVPAEPCQRCNYPARLPFGTAGLNVFDIEDAKLEAGLDALLVTLQHSAHLQESHHDSTTTTT